MTEGNVHFLTKPWKLFMAMIQVPLSAVTRGSLRHSFKRHYNPSPVCYDIMNRSSAYPLTATFLYQDTTYVPTASQHAHDSHEISHIPSDVIMDGGRAAGGVGVHVLSQHLV